MGKRWRCVEGVLLSALALLSCDTLSKGDRLDIAVLPNLLYTTMLPRPATVQDEAGCLQAQGAMVSILGTRGDYGVAKEYKVAVAITSSSATAALLPISNAPMDNIGVSTFDENGLVQFCLFPGVTATSVTVTANSGNIRQSTTVPIRDREVPAGGSLELTVTPLTTLSIGASETIMCSNMAPVACAPGRARNARVTLRATPPRFGPALPDGAIVRLTASRGWLSREGTCAGGSDNTTLPLTLTDGAAAAFWCFGDDGGRGQLTARSGAVVGTAELSVPQLAARLDLALSSIKPTAASDFTVTGVVSGCDGNPVPNMLVLFELSSGQLSAIDPVTAKTGFDGTVNMRVRSGTTGPASLRARLPAAPDKACQLDFTIVSPPDMAAPTDLVPVG